ncbi:hypothetical protein VTL71DRAFT_6474 [Oculimacula yallundae]|uniref:BZIP transcription factor n=1 Tax=Oculimacula yallundae TaxID=86028 RepID=A0ABR4BX46_9HELO
MDEEPPSSSARSRGRPRKGAKDDPQEEKRAKGRQAQRTYMQRKQVETDKLRKRISSLEDAIEGMSGEFLKFGERSLTTSQAQAPGLQKALEDLRSTTERFLSIARVAEAVAGDDGEEDGVFEKKGTGSPSLKAQKESAERSSLISQSCMSADMGIEMPFRMSTISQVPYISPPQFGIPPQIQSSSGRFSPSLGYGLLSGSPLQNAALSSLWTHYIIAGPNSFAMRLYKDTLILMFQVLRGEISIPGFIPSIGRFRFKYETTANFMSLAEGQLSRMTIGDSDVEMGANPNQTPAAASSLVLFGPSHPVMSAPLRAQIHSEVNYEIGSMSEWLDPWNTQQYLQSRWGLQCSYATASVSAERWASVNSEVGNDFANEPVVLPVGDLPSIRPWDPLSQQAQAGPFGDAALPGQAPMPPDLIFNSQPLAEQLIQEAVCFGEGPRFFKEHIDKAVRNFLGRAS